MSEVQPRLIFVNRFAPPDISATSQMLGSLVTNLAPYYDIHVVASGQKYDDAKYKFPKFEVIGSTHIHRVFTTRFGRGTILGRLLDYLSFYVTAPIKVLALARPGSIVVAMTDPPIISFPLSIVARLRRAKLINWLQDVFPEVAEALGMKIGGRFMVSALKIARNHSLRVAAHNVALGVRMADRVALSEPAAKISVIPNWSPTDRIAPLARDLNPLAKDWQITSEFVVGYSGNFGRVHDLAILVEAAAILLPRPEIKFLLIGDGAKKRQLELDVAARKLTNVVFKPYQPIEALEFSITLPDIHLVSLNPELEGLVVPSKFYACIAAAKPVLFIGAPNGELAKWVEGPDPCGIVVDPTDASGLASAISYLCDNHAHKTRMGNNARILFGNEFATAVALEKWRRTIQSIVCGQSPLELK